ncbi:MAG: NADH-quinone oxidoreductase subunit L [Armatimonadota bacterium]|nr:NADH-quinone oxidoreductase subunit L [Armatimonadota bacterium]MDW8156626.1 NADH-quinone oxidoreductase subunit L [Armatimonadota bacterium]
MDARAVPWIVALPLAGAVANGLWGGRLGRRGVSLVACLAVLAAFLVSAGAARDLAAAGPSPQVVRLFDWVAVGEFRASAALQWDPLSALLALVVTGVGFLIHVYSVGYMADDPDYSRYFTYLNLFVASMLVLVLGANLLVLFVGWELVGLCSYLLIGFWFERPAAAAAGRKAFVVNRLGDAAFVLGILSVWALLGTLEFREIWRLLGDGGGALRGHPGLVAASLLLFAGATGKSAQLPLYVWLPDAMEGPTPVSALIHAATMVTAGVFLVGRLWPLFEAAGPVLGAVVAPVGAATALFAATVAVTQYDLKRVLAYSTISQLGYMFLALGVGGGGAAFFHLTTHAFFKALLFLAAGSVMHALHGQIDLRHLGGLRRYMPLTFLGFVVGALSLAGIPPLSGFWSKEEILHAARAHAVGVWAVALVTSFVTAYYATRAAVLAFFGEAHQPAHAHDPPPAMAWPMAGLVVLSAVGGFVGAGWAAAPLHALLQPVFGEHGKAAAGSGEVVLAVSVAVAGVLAGWWAHRGRREPDLGPVGRVLAAGWGVEALYDRALVRPAKAFSRLLAERVDAGGIDRTASALAEAVVRAASAVRTWQTGNVRQYAAGVLAGAVVLFAYWVLR